MATDKDILRRHAMESFLKAAQHARDVKTSRGRRGFDAYERAAESWGSAQAYARFSGPTTDAMRRAAGAARKALNDAKRLLMGRLEL